MALDALSRTLEITKIRDYDTQMSGISEDTCGYSLERADMSKLAQHILEKAEREAQDPAFDLNFEMGFTKSF